MRYAAPFMVSWSTRCVPFGIGHVGWPAGTTARIVPSARPKLDVRALPNVEAQAAAFEASAVNESTVEPSGRSGAGVSRQATRASGTRTANRTTGASCHARCDATVARANFDLHV